MDERDRQLDDCFAAAAHSVAAGTPPAPDKDTLSARAKAGAMELNSRAVEQHGRLRLRLAEIAVVVLIMAGVVIMLVPWVRSRIPSGELPTASPVIETAWASTEGHVIEFTVRYASWDGYPDYFAPEHPRQVVTAAVDSWLAQHAGLEPQVAGLPLTAVSTSYVCRADPVPILRVQVSVALSDADLVAELAAYLASQTGYAAPTVSTQTMYYSSEYPELCSGPVDVRIDDRSYTFPYDFTADEARSIARDLGSWRTSYEGRFGFGISNRFGDFVVFKVEHLPGGVLDYAVITRELEVDEEVRSTISGHSNTVFEPDQEDRAHPWRDPVLELIRLGRFHNWTSQASRGQAETTNHVESHGFSTRLVPKDKWDALKARRQRLIAEGREQLPPLTDEDWAEIEEWARGLEEQLPADALEGTGKTWLELAREHHDDIRASMIDFETHDSEEYKSFPELTEAERSAAIQLAEQLREITRLWYADNAASVYETGPFAEISRHVRNVGGVPVSFLITLRCNEPEYADSLRAALEGVEGLVQKWEVTESSIGHSVGTDDQPPHIIGG